MIFLFLLRKERSVRSNRWDWIMVAQEAAPPQTVSAKAAACPGAARAYHWRRQGADRGGRRLCHRIRAGGAGARRPRGRHAHAGLPWMCGAAGRQLQLIKRPRRPPVDFVAGIIRLAMEKVVPQHGPLPALPVSPFGITAMSELRTVVQRHGTVRRPRLSQK